MVEVAKKNITYTRKDFISSSEIRWCPGCGDYSVLMALQKAMTEMNRKKEEFVVLSGIGCAGRTPYYIDTYGFHTIHGRAPAIATGVKIMEPDLSVWVITGDGDSLSIGGNHLIHALRRNIGINIVMLNNAIYGLTKGQSSPTSSLGTITKATPYGSIEPVLNALPLLIMAGGTFIARTADVLLKQMQEILVNSEQHEGTSFVEVLQNCHVFNDGVFKKNLDKSVRHDNIIKIEHGKPILFGQDNEKALVLDKKTLSLKTILVANVDEKDILIHDAHTEDTIMHVMLTQLKVPLVVGIIRQINRISYEQAIHKQEQSVIDQKGQGNLMELLHSGETWEVT